MKLSKITFLSLAVIIALCLTYVESKGKNKRSMSKSQYWIRPLIKTAKSYFSFANLAYCNVDVIKSLSCPLCSSIVDNSFGVADVHFDKYLGQTYKYVLLVSDTHKEIVISFAGPKSTDGVHLSKIYTSGWSKLHGERIEKTYLKIYNSQFSKPLKTSIKNLLKKNKETQNYKFIFIGHSFGGAMAVLSAFDLIKTKLINQNESPLVYTFGQLRIGDDEFVEEVNTLFKVIRIVKNNDYMTRLPNCVWSELNSQWKCYSDTNNLMTQYPEYKRYIMNYGGHQNNQHYSGLQAAYGSSFLEKSSRTNNKKGYQYTMNNPGQPVYSHGSTLENQGSRSFGNIYYSQPMGAEVIFSDKFKKFQVCSYFGGIPNCEGQLPKTFGPSESALYYGENVEEC